MVTQIIKPGAPVINSAIAGDGQVNIAWNPIAGATGYKIYKSTTAGMYESEHTTLSSSVYSKDITGLINGTTYYFTVKATNPGGDSPASNEVSAVPKTVSDAPTFDINCTIGDKTINVSKFNAYVERHFSGCNRRCIFL